MKYIVEIPDSKVVFAEQFFKSVDFLKKFKAIEPNVITNPKILNEIEAYETQKIKPTPLNLAELKALINA